MSQERKKVLEMLAQGKITAEDAERLLDRLSEPSREAKAGDRSAADPGPTGREPRYLRIQVDDEDDRRVNVRVPLNLVRTGLRLGAIVPERVRERLSEKGIDLYDLGELSEEMLDGLGEAGIDVSTDDGKVVRIFSE